MKKGTLIYLFPSSLSSWLEHKYDFLNQICLNNPRLPGPGSNIPTKKGLSKVL